MTASETQIPGLTKVGVEASASGQTVLLIHAQMPLANHVSIITSFSHQLRQEFLFQGHAVRLAWPDDLVLHTCTDLKHTAV